MKPELLFQRLVICSTALFIGGASVPWLLDSRLPEEINNALSWNGYGAKLPTSMTIWWFIALVRVLLGVGLYQFSLESRALFVVLEVYFGVTNLLGGLSVATATESFLLHMMMLSEGAILALAYTPPLRDKFTVMQREAATDESAAGSSGVKSSVPQPPEKGS